MNEPAQPAAARPLEAGSTTVRPATPRSDVHVRFPDGREFSAPVGTTALEFLRAAYPDPPVPIVAAILGGRLRELTFALHADTSAAPVAMSVEDGMRIYRRSLSFLMAAVASELFPDAQVAVEYSVYSGGYFCETRGRAPLSDGELARLAARMREVVEADLPLEKSRLPLDEARRLFESQGDDDKVRLLRYRRRDHLVIYSLRLPDRCFRDYFHGYLVPSTGYLRWFGLQQADGGFILQFPRRGAPTRLEPPVEHDRLFAAFREYNEWLGVLGIGDVGSLNDAVRAGRMRELILVSEALHEKRIAQMAAHVVERRAGLVLIAGPSASGKTTFSKRLSIQLLAHGPRPFALAMDDYFVERSQTARNDQGEADYESLQALDLELLERDLLALMNGEEVTLPRYNFRAGQRERGETVRLTRDHVIIVEGIHGLNPDLLPRMTPERVYRIYVSALTAVNLDRHNRVSTTDTRLIRRIVRDATTRGYPAQATLRRWESVREGEAMWIFPHQENADEMFNTALAYELVVLRPLVEPLLLQVPPDTPEHIEAKRLLAKLEWFDPGLGAGLTAGALTGAVPDNSILREFLNPATIFDDLDFHDTFA
jgi:uridine kinase